MKIILWMVFCLSNLILANTQSDLKQVIFAATKSPVTVGEFKQIKSVKKINREFISTGIFCIHKDKGILWNTENPFATILWVSENEMTQILNGTEKKMDAKENPIFLEFSKAIRSIFEGNVDKIEQNFTVNLKKEGDIFKVTLTPKDAVILKVIKSIELMVKSDLEKVTVFDGENNPTTYEFFNQKHFDSLENTSEKIRNILGRFVK